MQSDRGTYSVSLDEWPATMGGVVVLEGGMRVAQATAEDIARIEAKVDENTALLRRLIDAMAEEEEGEEGVTHAVEIVGLDGTRHVIPTADPRPVSLSARGGGQKSKAVGS